MTSNRAEQKPNIISRLDKWIWSYQHPDDPFWQRLLRALLKIHIIIFREFNRDRITLRASALTFTVVLSLVPMLAMGTAILKGLGSGDEIRAAAYVFVDRISSPLVEQKQESLQDDETAPDNPPEQKNGNGENFNSHLHLAVDKVFDYVERTNFAALGTAGMLTLVFAVALMLNSIEQAMNDIWQAHCARSIGRKIVDYLALIILLPLTINVAFFVEATFRSPTLKSLLEDTLPLHDLALKVLNILPVLLVIGTFTLLYSFLPNRKVKFTAALAGGIAGGIGWFLTQTLYFRVQIEVSQYNAIYGSFATLPLFLLWIYVGWVVFLTGAEMAFAVQVWRRYILGKAVLNPTQKLALAFDIIEITSRDFNNRRLTFVPDVALALKLPDPHVKTAMDELVEKGILRRVKDRELGYCPATQAERILPSEIVEIILGRTETDTHGGELAVLALTGARGVMKGKRLDIA